VHLFYSWVIDLQRGIREDGSHFEHFSHPCRSTFVSYVTVHLKERVTTDALVRPTKLLNYMTAPDTVIWSALLASAAVPGILNPVVLMQKLKDGSIVPWSWGSRFKDGSLRYAFPQDSCGIFF